MGYELYRQLSLRRDKLRGRKKGRKSQFELPDFPEEGRNKQLWDGKRSVNMQSCTLCSQHVFFGKKQFEQKKNMLTA
jgi:hypothetical protein